MQKAVHELHLKLLEIRDLALSNSLDGASRFGFLASSVMTLCSTRIAAGCTISENAYHAAEKAMVLITGFAPVGAEYTISPEIVKLCDTAITEIAVS